MPIDPQKVGADQDQIDWFIKRKCEKDLLFFTRYMFKEHLGKKFKLNSHHRQLANDFMRIERGEVGNCCINLPPRFTKTELFKMWAARSFANNPQSSWVHATYSDDLALDNSATIMSYVQSPTFQKFWPLEIDKRRSAKKLWFIKDGGGFRAASSGSGITGFGAGAHGWKRGDLFAGCVLLDDPLKPDDMFSKVMRDRINNRLVNTFESRVNSPEVPVVLMHQRLVPLDPSGFVLKGNSELTYEQIKYKALLDDGSALWGEMMPAERLLLMKEKNRYKFSSQYQQEPTDLEGGLVQLDWFGRFGRPPEQPDMVVLSCDTAIKENQWNDPSVLGVWFVKDGRSYLVEVVRDRFDYPRLKRAVLSLADKYSFHAVLIEDKASGQSLIQDLQKNSSLPIIAIMPTTDKISRLMAESPQIEGGLVYLPHHASWLVDFENEITEFPLADFDDQVDMLSQFLKWMRERVSGAEPRILQL